MCISYGDYKKCGHSVIPKDPKEEFARYILIAEKQIRRYVKSFDSVTDETKRCVYEIADILYADQKQINRPLSGFSNEGYREQYAVENKPGINAQIFETLRLYFTGDELYRGVKNLC